MKAMILAAGLGTRLGNLTSDRPKALVEVDGVPMLERVILNLKNKGFNKIFVNVHHFAPLVKKFLSEKDFGVDIIISDESEELLDTGGGIVKASPLLFRENREPVLFHNVDILSNADLASLTHKGSAFGSSGELLVSDRNSTRKLVFNENMNLIGWHDISNDIFRPQGFLPLNDSKEYAFSGIYVLGYEAVNEMGKIMDNGKYSVMDYFVNPERECQINGFLQENLKLLDIGKPATLLQASKFIEDI